MKPLVLFVCKHNTGRSQMAEAFLRRLAGEPSHARPKLLDPEVLAKADRIITMGCDVEGVPRIDDDWGLPDPKGQPLERVREIRDLARAKAVALAKELLRADRLNPSV